jgi:hypothetical protein
MSQDTRRYFSTFTEETTNRSDSRALFIEETILGACRERLASKDERIAELEKKLVEMSFELASLKALADEHGAKRRIPCGFSHADATASSSLQADSHRCVTSTRRHSLPAEEQVHRQHIISGLARSEP